MNEINDKTRKLMAEQVSEFLKSRMEMTRKIIKNQNVNTITLDEFNYKYRKSNDNYYKILLSDEEITEFVNFIKESIEKYGLGNDNFSKPFTFVIPNIIKNIIFDNKLSIREYINKLGLINRWIKTAYNNINYGIDPRIEGKINYGYFDELFITNSKDQLVVRIGFDGTNKLKDKEPLEENILIGNNIFLKKIKLLNECNELVNVYEILLKENNIETKQNEIKLFDLFKNNNLSYLMEDLYTEKSLNNAIYMYDNYCDFTKEEKVNIEKIVEVATKWWSNKLKMVPNKNVEKFKKYLGNEIRISLCLLKDNYYFEIHTLTFKPSKYFEKSLDKSKIDYKSIKQGNVMHIDKEKILIGTNFDLPEKEIYNIRIKQKTKKIL